jgi:putative membrane protein
MMHEYWGYGFGGNGMFFGLGPLIFLALIAGAVYLVFRDRPSPEESALDIIKRRYARGEITKEQFEQMKQDLE